MSRIVSFVVLADHRHPGRGTVVHGHVQLPAAHVLGTGAGRDFSPAAQVVHRAARLGTMRVAAGLTTAAILLIVLIPTLLILTRAAAEAFTLATELDPDVVRASDSASCDASSISRCRRRTCKRPSASIGFGSRRNLRRRQITVRTPDGLAGVGRAPRHANWIRFTLKLALEGPHGADESFTLEAREHIAASWQTFHEQDLRLARGLVRHAGLCRRAARR